jgi:hypothetical protein
MDRWAADYQDRANFLCVGCAGPNLSSQFGQELKLASCINAVCDEGDMPSWGQLGCNGFIVLDGDHKVVKASTSPFQQVRGLAFKHVEALVDALVGGQPVPKFCPGQFVYLQNLNTASLNGELGVCLVQSEDADTRVEVQLQSGRKIKVLPKNLAVASEDDDEEAADADAGSSTAGG